MIAHGHNGTVFRQDKLPMAIDIVMYLKCS